MARNKIMLTLAGFCLLALIVAVLELYTVFSFVAVLVVVTTMAVAGIERGESELDISPYGGFIAVLGVSFAIGMAFTWIGWSSSFDSMSFSYVLGLPLSTAGAMLFVWLLPVIGGSLYFAFMIWPETASEQSIQETIDEAEQQQSTGEFPLAGFGREEGGD